MLLRKSYDVIKTISLNLVFDDLSTKNVNVSMNDTVDVVYNKNGCRNNIVGIVTRIEVSNCEKDWYMIIDGSTDANSKIARVTIDDVIDIDMIRKSSENVTITSPEGDGLITGFRIFKDVLQFSCDYGKTWVNICKIQGEEVIVDPEDQELANKISKVIPINMCQSERLKIIEDLVDLFKESTKENEESVEEEITE